MGHEESEEPLLTVSVDLPPESSDALDGPRPEEVGNAKTLQQALYRNPREAIKWLEKEGVKKLGTFRVQVRDLRAKLPLPVLQKLSMISIESCAGVTTSILILDVLLLHHLALQSTKTANLRSDPAAMSTIGTDDKNFDWEDAWRNRLDAPEPPLSGILTKSHNLAYSSIPTVEAMPHLFYRMDLYSKCKCVCLTAVPT